MKTDVNGVSTCPTGQEQYEFFQCSYGKKLKYVQYDFRLSNGNLFSTVAPTLEIARERRNKWIERQNINY